MKRLFMAAAVAALAAAIPSPVAAAGATCTYNAAQHKVTVAITGALYPYPTVYPISGGYISLNGNACGGTTLATLANTDTIVVTGDSQAQDFYISFGLGPFTPGFTNEAGSSDEVEFSINLGGGIDTLVIVGNNNVNKYVFGQDNSQAGVPRKVNLNAGESTGIDGDVTFTNIEKVKVWGQGGGDSILARGKVGTGPNAFSLPMLVYGGAGADVIKGGEAEDRIYGDAGKDKVWGFGLGDFIHLDEGAAGDQGYGGAGNDAAYLDAGDSWQPN
jgi:hypothetical protein